ncbi:hypothetical protein D917_07264 [Trichinella nativa]|uniref:Uncharacterized protein n=1 Tax=Trichinella nativa TaxID=6335 RepID=A0A1Y3EPC2_9BILA|nr:hypothetical protein D917_07264 [Trichinella nativa]
MYCEVLIASNSRPNKNASNDVSLSSNELYSMVSTTGNCKKLMRRLDAQLDDSNKFPFDTKGDISIFIQSKGEIS